MWVILLQLFHNWHKTANICFLSFQLAQGSRYCNLTKNNLLGPPFRRQKRLFSQSLTSSFWSYLRLICNQTSQSWVSPEVLGGAQSQILTH